MRSIHSFGKSWMAVMVLLVAVGGMQCASAQEQKASWVQGEIEFGGISFVTAKSDAAISVEKKSMTGNISSPSATFGAFRMLGEQKVSHMIGAKAWLWNTIGIGARVQLSGEALMNVGVDPLDGHHEGGMSQFGEVMQGTSNPIADPDYQSAKVGILQDRKHKISLRCFLEAKTSVVGDYYGLHVNVFSGYEPVMDETTVCLDKGNVVKGSFMLSERKELGKQLLVGRLYGGLEFRFSRSISSVAVFRLFLSQMLESQTITATGREHGLMFGTQPLLPGVSLGILL